MSFFGNEDFDEMVKGFFGGSSGNFKTSSQRKGKMPVNKIESDKNIYFVFDFSNENNLDVKIEEKSRVNEYGEKIYGKNKVLGIVSSSQKIAEYILPEKIKIKTMEYTFNNGILEVSFKKWKAKN